MRPPGGRAARSSPSVTPFPPCPGFRPKQADLVVNGIAEATYRHSSGIAFNTVSLVLADPARWCRLDWQRTVLDPRVAGLPALPDDRRTRARASTRSSRSRGCAFPRVAPFTSAYRVIYDDRTAATEGAHLPGPRVDRPRAHRDPDVHDRPADRSGRGAGCRGQPGPATRRPRQAVARLRFAALAAAASRPTRITSATRTPLPGHA